MVNYQATAWMNGDSGMSKPEANARNGLQELLDGIGMLGQQALRVSHDRIGEQTFAATVTVTLPSGEVLSRTAAPTVGKTASTLRACADLLDSLPQTHPELFPDWEALRVEAQRGDALVKLAAYLAPDLPSAADGSYFLQDRESDAHFARLFTLWRAEGDKELAQWGEHLSEKRKSTLVEALIWRRWGPKVLADQGEEDLGRLLDEIRRS